MESIFEEGQDDKKAGVYVSGIAPESAHQHTLFVSTDRDRQKKVMAIMDEINKKMGNGRRCGNALKLAAIEIQ